MRVVFLGNHTVGTTVLRTMAETDEVAGVVAHPPDAEDGVRYESVAGLAAERGWNVVRGRAKDPAVERFVVECRPDLLWITDYRYLLPKSLLDVAPLGTVNLHPSLLPKFRGRAPVNWAILHGESELGLTAHFVEEGMDTGDIIAQKRFTLSEDQDVGDALRMLYPIYSAITREVLGMFRAGQVPRIRQDHAQATAFPRRTPDDGLIDWSQPARAIFNLVRAVASPYPGAFTSLDENKLIIWKARWLPERADRKGRPGEVLACGDGAVLIQCGDGVLQATKVEGPTASLCEGVVLGSASGMRSKVGHGE